MMLNHNEDLDLVEDLLDMTMWWQQLILPNLEEFHLHPLVHCRVLSHDDEAEPFVLRLRKSLGEDISKLVLS